MSTSSRAVIFDMDGTLTRPVLDFDLIRSEIGLQREPVLEAVLAMTGPQRDRAEEILHRHESAAAAASELQEGAAEVVSAIRCAGIPIALMTRNSRESVRVFQHRHNLPFDLIRTREDGLMKPSPAPVLEICAALGATAAASWVVGDFHYDIVCGRRAGATTVLLLEPGATRPGWAVEADHVITRLPELLDKLGLARATPQRVQ